MRILWLAAVGLVALAAGCGTTEKAASVGDELTAEDLEVTVEKVDQKPPRPKRDVTGLSLPADGYKLVGVRVKVCSGHGGAINSSAFSIEASEGEGRLKFPARNYRDDFKVVRDDCGDGWIVFEIPEESNATKVKFEFEDTGHGGPARDDGTKAKFEWAL